MTCTKWQHQACKRFGYFGKCRIQRGRCTSCKATFCEPHTKLTRDTMTAQPAKPVMAVQCLLEGCSIRATERLTRLNRNTIYASVDYLRLPQRSNYEHHDERLHSRYWQVDEIWTYCGKKQRRARKEDGPDVADQWVFVAIGEETKVVPAFHVGKRYRKDTREFMWNLYARISNRVQITTDGLVHYIRLRLPMLLDSMLISPSS